VAYLGGATSHRGRDHTAFRRFPPEAGLDAPTGTHRASIVSRTRKHPLSVVQTQLHHDLGDGPDHAHPSGLSYPLPGFNRAVAVPVPFAF